MTHDELFEFYKRRFHELNRERCDLRNEIWWLKKAAMLPPTEAEKNGLTLGDIIRERGPIDTVRVSLTHFDHCGVAFYQLRLDKNGNVANVCVRGQGAKKYDHRLRRVAESDAAATGRIPCQTIGQLSDGECRWIMRTMGQNGIKSPYISHL